MEALTADTVPTLDELVSTLLGRHIFHVITNVWGRHHVELFLTLTLPNILSSGNLPALARIGRVIYRVFTTPSGRDQIEESEAGRRLAGLVEVEYVTPLGDRVPEPIWHVHWFHRSTAEAKAAGAIAVFVPPDTLWTDGSFARAAELIVGGKRGIACPFLQVVGETCIPEARARFLDVGTGVLTIPPAELWPLARAHLHPLQILGTPRAPHGRPVFELHWQIGDEGWLSRYAVREMFAFDPRRCPITFLWNADGTEDLEGLYLGTGTDDIMMLSVDPLAKYLQNYILDHSVHAFDVARTTLHPLNTTQQTRVFVRHNVEIASGPPSAARWRRTELLAAAAARDIRVGRAAMQVCAKLIDFNCGVMADLLGVALLDTAFSKRWRVDVPLTVLAVPDPALTPQARSSAAALMQTGQEHQLARLLRNHVIKGHLQAGRAAATLEGTPVAFSGAAVNGQRVLGGPVPIEGLELYIVDGLIG